VSSLAFVVPAWRRFEIAEVCLGQLRETCRQLERCGIGATAVVVADDENLEVARALGFGTVERENSPLGRKWNDGFQLAGRELGVDYVVPFGTDNWIDPDLVAELPTGDAVGAHRLCTLVHERGRRMMTLRVPYDGGDGIRIIPTKLLEPLEYRPAEEDAGRAIDTSIWRRLTRVKPVRFEYLDIHALQVVSFQSEDYQLNSYDSLRGFRSGPERQDVWEALAGCYSAAAVDAMRRLYEHRSVPPRPRPGAVLVRL
jgi:hypothetical protein